MYDYWDLKKMYEDLKKENQQLKKQKDDGIKDIDYKTAYETVLDFNKFLSEKYNELQKQKDDVVKCCKNSIKSIDEKLTNNKERFEVVDGKIIYINDYQVVRLKAIRMKCKEILRMLGEIE